ncbi:MAG TPA: hypothetical protein VKU36_05530 [Candidatus Babeliales bacterium]|nr:hypothetical protein [Candidatus Babeliales bacterium]
MKKFMRDKKISKLLLLFYFSYLFTLLGMENPDLSKRLSIIYDDSSIKPEKTMTIFNHKDELKFHRSWCEVVPGIIMITPDNKGVVIGVSGRVLYSSFDKEDDREPECIIKHPEVKHSPLIAMAQKEDKSLLVVSAGNYINSEKNAVSEYFIYSSSHGFSKLHNLNWPIQAISLDATGNTLAIAGLQAVMVIDFESQKHDMATFKKEFRSENWIIDIAMNPKGSAVIAVGSQKGIQWMHMSKKEGNVDLANLKQIDVHEKDIKKIYYPSLGEFFYLTQDGRAKIVDMYSLLENNGEELKSTPFGDSSKVYDMVVGDPSEHVATAHWTNNIRLAGDIRKKIEIYRKEKDDLYINKFILDASALEDRYVYITSQGKRDIGDGHLLMVALRDRYVAALGSDGKMFLWKLPLKRTPYAKLDQKEGYEHQGKTVEEKAIELQAVTRHISEKKHNSPAKRFSVSNPSIATTSTADSEKKKRSPRDQLVENFKRTFSNSSAANSRESSPVRKELAKDADNIKYSPRSASEPVLKNSTDKG